MYLAKRRCVSCAAVERRTKRRHVRQLRGYLEKSSQPVTARVVGLVVTAPSMGRGASEIRRELRWPVRYDHSHCD